MEWKQMVGLGRKLTACFATVSGLFWTTGTRRQLVTEVIVLRAESLQPAAALGHPPEQIGRQNGPFGTDRGEQLSAFGLHRLTSATPKA